MSGKTDRKRKYERQSAFYRALQEKIEVTPENIARGMDQISWLMLEYEEWAEDLLPLYERLEAELAAMEAKAAKIALIRERGARYKLEQKR